MLEGGHLVARGERGVGEGEGFVGAREGGVGGRKRVVSDGHSYGWVLGRRETTAWLLSRIWIFARARETSSTRPCSSLQA